MKKAYQSVVLDCTFSTVYTLEEVKKAFWATFHESGELWFDYLGTHENNTEVTEEWWDTFLEELNAAHKRG